MTLPQDTRSHADEALELLRERAEKARNWLNTHAGTAYTNPLEKQIQDNGARMLCAQKGLPFNTRDNGKIMRDGKGATPLTLLVKKGRDKDNVYFYAMPLPKIEKDVEEYAKKIDFTMWSVPRLQNETEEQLRERMKECVLRDWKTINPDDYYFVTGDELVDSYRSAGVFVVEGKFTPENAWDHYRVMNGDADTTKEGAKISELESLSSYFMETAEVIHYYDDRGESLGTGSARKSVIVKSVSTNLYHGDSCDARKWCDGTAKEKGAFKNLECLYEYAEKQAAISKLFVHIGLEFDASPAFIMPRVFVEFLSPEQKQLAYEMILLGTILAIRQTIDEVGDISKMRPFFICGPEIKGMQEKLNILSEVYGITPPIYTTQYTSTLRQCVRECDESHPKLAESIAADGIMAGGLSHCQCAGPTEERADRETWGVSTTLSSKTYNVGFVDSLFYRNRLTNEVTWSDVVRRVKPVPLEALLAGARLYDIQCDKQNRPTGMRLKNRDEIEQLKNQGLHKVGNLSTCDRTEKPVPPLSVKETKDLPESVVKAQEESCEQTEVPVEKAGLPAEKKGVTSCRKIELLPTRTEENLTQPEPVSEPVKHERGRSKFIILLLTILHYICPCLFKKPEKETPVQDEQVTGETGKSVEVVIDQPAATPHVQGNGITVNV